MSLEPDRRYDGVIIDAGLTQSQEKQTPALWFKIRTTEGTIDHEEYVTANTRQRVAENMSKCFAIGISELVDLCYKETLGERVRGMDVSIVTKAEDRRDGNGFDVKVKWMNPPGGPPKKPATPATKSRVAQLFGAPSAGPMPRAPAGDGPPPFAPDDDLIPF